jgi:flagellar protein FlgJ
MTPISGIPPKAALAVPRIVQNEPAPNPAETARLRRAAQDFESVFLNHMLKTMRQASTLGPGLGGGSGQRMYRELLNEELAKSIARGGGFGLADVLVRDLIRSLPRVTEGSENNASSPPAKGPIPEGERRGSLETEPR